MGGPTTSPGVEMSSWLPAALVDLCCRALDCLHVYMVLNGPRLQLSDVFSAAFLCSRFDSVWTPRPKHSKTKSIRCLRSSNYGWVWPISIPPVPKNNQLPKNRTQNRTKMPISSIFFIAFAFWGLEPNKIYVVQDNPQLPLANERLSLIHI